MPPNIYFLRLFLISLLCYAAGKLSGRDTEQSKALYSVLALSVFSFAVLLSWFFSEPLLWYGLQYLSESASGIVGATTGQKALFNASASGLFISVFMVLIGIFSTALSTRKQGRWLRLSWYIGSILAANLIFMALLQPAYARIQSLISIPRFQIMDLPVLLFALDIVPLMLFLRPLELVPLTFQLFPVRAKQAIAVGVFSLGMLLMVFRQQSAFSYEPSAIRFQPSPQAGSSTAISHELSANGSRRTVLIYGIGVYNWDKPQFGNYGIQSAGMFGMFPSYLETMGYNVRVDSTLTRQNLDSADVVTVINLGKNMPEREKSDLQRYIYHGGSLLVIGDHTGLAGIMEPLNDLLKFVNIRYRFDCGHWLVDDWRDAFEYPAHPLFRGISDESDIAISIGASLDFSPINATPILFAKYGFSDWGNPLNSQGAYLGNRKYDPGEKLGDIVLAASTSYGKGKVLVFGDTSSFQNDALIYSFQFVKNVFDWLTTRDALSGNIVRWIANLLMLVGLILMFTVAEGLRRPLVVVGAMTLAVLVFTTIAVLDRARQSSMTAGSTENIVSRMSSLSLPTGQAGSTYIAYVDASHLNAFTQYEDNAIWPLTHNLIRNGYLPFVRRKFSPALLNESKIAFFIAPEKEFSNYEMRKVNAYMKDGGIVVWSTGMETIDASMPMLDEMGLSLDNVPLGPVSDRAAMAEFTITPVNTSLKNYMTGAMVIGIDSSGMRPEFHSAWPIVVSSNRTVDILCTGWDYPVIVSEQVGRGKFVLISDSGFFLNGNLESKTIKPYGYTVLGGDEMVFRALIKKLIAHG